MKPHLLSPLLLVQQMLTGTPYTAFLFGSRASGREHSKSDWDIAITGPQRLDSILLMEIEEAIEKANFLQPVDLVDVYTAPVRLKKEISKFSMENEKMALRSAR